MVHLFFLFSRDLNKRKVVTSPNNPKSFTALHIVIQQISRGSCYLRWAITEKMFVVVSMKLALGHPLSSVASLDYSIEHILDICVQKFRCHILVCCPEGRIFIAVNGTQLKDKCHIKRCTYRRQSIIGNFQQKIVRRVESLNLIFKIF